MDIAIEGLAGSPARLAAQAALDPDFPGDTQTLVSFLVNALYLFGGQSIAAPGAPAEVTAELTRLGHRVARAFPEDENRSGRGSEGGGPGRSDRIFLARALGFAADPAERLRALRRALRPGGLVCFHLLDRDRAWEKTGVRSIRAGGAPVEASVDFDPASGRLIARVPRDGGPGPAVGAQTWNLAEVKGLLRSVGLELERAYGDWSGAGPGTPSGSLIIVAAKPLGGARRRKGSYSSSVSTSSSSIPRSSSPSSNPSGSSSATMAATLSTSSLGEKGLPRKSAKASPTSSTTPSVAP